MVPGSWSGSGGLQSPPEAGLGEGLGGEGEGELLQNLRIYEENEVFKNLHIYLKICVFIAKFQKPEENEGFLIAAHSVFA